MEEHIELNEVSVNTKLERAWKDLEAGRNKASRNPAIADLDSGKVKQSIGSGLNVVLSMQSKVFFMSKAVNEALHHLSSSVDTRCRPSTATDDGMQAVIARTHDIEMPYALNDVANNLTDRATTLEARHISTHGKNGIPMADSKATVVT